VDLHIQKELSSAVLDEALAQLDREPDARTRAAIASRVKARCSDAALTITRAAIQLHGGIGFTDEHDIGLYLKRAMTVAAWLGNAQAHRRRYAALTVKGEG
jgi:alkylation response protein AidB-like acyl-CoA dehydrogenase